MNYTIEQITVLMGARRYGSRAASIGFLLTDSRSLCFPEETLFFALVTRQGDGHKYIDELYRRGVRNFVVSHSETVSDAYVDANFLLVEDTLVALQRLSERHRDEFDIPVIGITGSNGKTMVKEWLYQILRESPLLASPKGEGEKGSGSLGVTRSPRSYNSQIGVPLSVWLLNERSRLALFEAGISQPGEMAALHDIIQPTIGVLTHLGPAHQENFRSMEEKCLEKMQLFHDTEAVIYCTDDETVSHCMRRSGYRGKRIGWSRKDPQAAMYIQGVQGEHSTLHIPHSTISFVFQGAEDSFTIPFIDEASVENAITTATVALYLGVKPEELAACMAHLEPVAMRLEVMDGRNGCTLINDSYNSDINSLDIALDFMQRRSGGGTLILSDIYQSGMNKEELYRQVMELAVKRGVRKFIGIGPELKRMAAMGVLQPSSLIPHPSSFFETVEEFLRSCVFASLRNEVILIKGARAFGFDRITEQLSNQVHETTLEVNLNAVVENLNRHRAFLRPETKLVCMIKASNRRKEYTSGSNR